MAGGLIQLMSYGYADKVLIGDPQITFFKKVYHKHSLFAIQDHEILSESEINFGSSTNFKLRNYGDLFFSPYLKITLPEVQVEYEKTIDEYINEYNSSSKINDNNVNLILSKLNAIIHNYKPSKLPIGFPNGYLCEHTHENDNVFNFCNDHIAVPTILKQDVTTVYNTEYDNLFEIDLNATDYEKYKSLLVTCSSTDQTTSRNIYYSTFNVNYLTTQLNLLDLTDDNIILDDNYFSLFRNELFLYITKNYENEFLYTITKSKDVFQSEFTSKNKILEITNEIDYIISYYYTNMNILYIYSAVDSDQFKLKYIGFINDYVYSGSNFTNVMTTFNNLYTQFETGMSGNNKHYIASGFDLNKKFKITPITNFDISSNSYSLTFDTSKVEIDPNIVYFIYPDIKPADQGINLTNLSYPNYEDYYKIYYTDFTSAYSSEMYEPESLLLPTCVLKYNSDTGLFDKIELSQSVTEDDYIFMYNDVLIYNSQSQQNQYTLINDKLFTINDISSGSYIYSSGIFLESQGVDIVDNIANIDGIDSFFIYSTENSLEFIDNLNSSNTFVTSTYTSPYQVLYTINSESSSQESFYFENRLRPINFVKNSTINLDSYENFIFNKSELENINIDTNLKNSVAVNNINLTINENIVYITNILNSFLNLFVFFQQYNPFQISSTTKNLNLTISPTTKTNFLKTIFTTGNINGTNNFYNGLQDIISSYIDNFLDIIDTYFTKVVRNIYNLKNEDNNTYTQDTKLVYILSNLSKMLYFIRIGSSSLKNSSLKNSSIVPYTLNDGSLTDGKCKIFFKPTGTDPIVDISTNMGIGLPKDISGYYYIDNVSIVITTSNPTDNNLPYYLFPSNFVVAKQFYLLMYLLNYSSDTTTMTSIYITPPSKLSSDADFSDYEVLTYKTESGVTKNKINIIYDSIDSGIVLPSDLTTSKHYLPEYYNSVTTGIKTVVDVANITYHYAYNLYMNIKDATGKNLLKSDTKNNYFSIYNDKKMFENLWNIMQINGKNTKNASYGLDNIANLSTTYSYLTTSINFASIIDHVIINNSIVSSIDEFFSSQIRTNLVSFLTDKKDYFNFFATSNNFNFINSLSTSRIDLDVDLNNLTFIKQFYWYLNYLNAIISDTKSYVVNYKSETLFNCQLSDFISIKDYFDTSANIFNGSTYLGSIFNLTVGEYNTIIDINTMFNSVIIFIINLLENETITLDNNQINLYTSIETPTIYNNVIFNNLTLGELIFSLPSYYTNNYFLTYKYADIISFYNDVKTSYIDQYKLILEEFLNYGSFSNSYYSELKQFLNFSINDYEKSMEYFQKNINYSELDDQYIQLYSVPPILNENYYKYSIVNSVSFFDSNQSVSNFITNYFNNKKSLLDATNNTFRLNINLLDFLYENVDNVIETFNNFFGKNYVFYSDYKLIYPFLLYFYDTFSFVYQNTTYHMFLQDLENNTSTTNYIKNTSNNYEYKYTDVCFVDSNNQIKFTIVNNQFFDLSNNIAIGYDYSFDNINQVESIYNYSSNFLYIINNKIYDSSNNKLYTIKNNLIYDLSGSETIIGSGGSDIYVINSIEYKYKIDEYKRQKLYSNYVPVSPESDGSYIINGINCFAKYNVFYDKTNKTIQFYSIISDTDEEDLNFKVEDISGTLISTSPLYIRKTLSKTQTPLETDLSPIFSSVFSNTNNSKTINSINTTIRNNLGVLDEDLNINLGIQLLNNCVKNSIFPSKYFSNEIIICTSFNDLVDNETITSSTISNIADYTDWLVSYNNSEENINKIVVLNTTDQTIHTVEDFISGNYENKKFNFIPEGYSTYHIDSNGYIVQPTTLSENFEHEKILNHKYMLVQAQNLQNLTNTDSTIPDYLESIKTTSSSIKGAIIQKIILDISNGILDESLYKPYTYFNINGSNVTLETNDNNMSSNSYFIYNCNVITFDEREAIFNLDLSNYTVTYDEKNFIFQLEDISGSKYLITTNTQPLDEMSWDISNNDHYFKFNEDTKQVIINVLNSQTFHPTLFIYEGKINRLDNMEFGFELDSSFNLMYTYRYDLSVNVMSKAISKLNYGIFNDNDNAKYYVDQKIQITPYNTLVDFSLNCLTNQNLRDAWTEIDLIEDISAVYIKIENVLNVPIDIFNQFVIFYNKTDYTKTIFDIIYMCNVSGTYLLKLHPLQNNFVYSSSSTYELQIGIANFIDLIGTDILNTRCVLYYWEKFYSGIDLAFDILNDTTDSKFIENKFTCVEYRDKIYEYISQIVLQDNEYNSLFEIPECIFDKKVGFIINVFRNYETAFTYFIRVIQIHKKVIAAVENLFKIINRSTLPTCSWINYLGHFLIDKITFKIDDNTIEELDSQILHIYNYLNSTTSKDIGLEKMIGYTSDLTQPLNKTLNKTIYVPLPFFFKNPEKALPIISLLYSELSINLKLKNLDSLIIKPIQTKLVQKGKIKVKLYGSYVYLDSDERTKFSQMRHEYLISIKKSYKHFISENSGSLKLDLNLPASEIFWFYLDSNLLIKKSYWNYTGINYKLYHPDSLLTNVYNADDDVTEYINSLTSGRATYINNLLEEPIDSLSTNISILTSEELESLRNYIRNRIPFEITNPFVSSELEYNGHKRFTLDGNFTNLLIPSAHYADTLSFGLNVYNFSRYPKEITHSGALNFKYATNIRFNYNLEFNDGHNADGEIYFIFKTMNVLRIASGIGCLAW